MKLILNCPSKIEINTFEKLQSIGLVKIEVCLIWKDEMINSLNIFPDSIIVNNSNLVKNGLSGCLEDVDQSIFTPEIKNSLNWGESICYEMMDRMDILKTFTFKQRKNLYKYLVCYWVNLIQQTNPDLFFSKTTPHEVSDFVLFMLCKHYKIRTLLFNYLSFNGKMIVSDDYRQPWNNRLGKSNQELNNTTNLIIDERIIDNDANLYLERLKMDYSQAKPKYELYYDKISPFNENSNEPFHILINFFGRIKRFLKYIYLAFKLLFQKIPDFDSLLKYTNALKIKFESNNLRQSYLKYQVPVPTNISTFIYFPLHFQPEVTTSPQGGIFTDQHLVASILSKSIPENWKILIKEHPGHFRKGSFFTYSYLGRDKIFYKNLAAIPKVLLIPVEADHFSILDKSNAVATITGTVGWEAVVRGKPVLIFGDAWYQYAPNVFRVTTQLECLHVIKKLQSRTEFDTNKLNSYVNSIISMSDDILFDELEAKWAGREFDLETNVKKLHKILCRELGFND
jgi:hypothetical protein